MIILKSNGKEIRCLASNLARHYYFSEFDEEIDAAIQRVKQGVHTELVEKIKQLTPEDIAKISQGDFSPLLAVGLSVNDFTDVQPFPVSEVHKIIWAMNKAARKSDGVPFSPYEDWLDEIGDFNVKEVLENLDKEIAKGFFR
jgi:hypothetical protein